MQHNRRGQKVCYRCGSLAHHHRDCPFTNAVCYGCDHKGHTQQAVCRSSGKPDRKGRRPNTWWNNEHRISQLRCSLLPHMSINRRFYYKFRTVFELDTGAAVSLVGPDIWKRIGSPHLTSPKIQLFSYGKQPIPVKGECNVTDNGENQTLH